MTLLDGLTLLLLGAASFFFTAGTIGLLRLPDLHSRLHALTKADNVGLGFTVAALMLQAADWTTVFKLVLMWVLILAAGATVSFLIAERACRSSPFKADRMRQ
jgi:multicomponent Na+:H+ antiporter subunit G